MNRKQRGLRRWDGMIGFSLVVVLLSMLVCADPAAAQCGPGSGSENTQCGDGALASNATGVQDSAFGFDALTFNITGSNNTASGVDALYHNITGNSNTASGDYALALNIAGNNNAAHGNYALYNNTTGNNNSASGDYALYNNITGRSNIGFGYNAGNNIVGGRNNIDIGGSGPSDEFNTIRIGNNNTQSATFIAGISETGVTGSTVEVTSSGQLGVAFSSARYKRDIQDMGNASAGLMKLRPVSFRYKNDSTGTLQYGLVAEEVEQVYPELVTRGPVGKAQSVRYLELTALLLNELQKQTRENNQLSRENRELRLEDRELDQKWHKSVRNRRESEPLSTIGFPPWSGRYGPASPTQECPP